MHHLNHFIITLLSLWFSLVHHASCLGIKFITPAAGATITSGTITVTWDDAGGFPDMALLTTFKLDVMVGGNSPSDSQVIQTIDSHGALIAVGQATGVIPANVAQSIQNGFYLRMTSQTTNDNEVLNYSDRFTLLNMNGTTDSQYLEGANAMAGSVTNVPEGQYNVVMSAPSTSSQSASETSTAKPSDTANPSQTPISPTPDNSDDGSGLPNVTLGLIIMGSILALVGVISIVIWILFFYRRMKRKREEGKTDGTPEDPFFLGNKTELGAYRSSRAMSTSQFPVEMNGERDRQELSGTDKSIEVPASPVVYELEGDLSIWEAGSGRKSKAWEAV